MFDFVNNIFKDLHPIIVHFPIALLVLSFGLTVVARHWPSLHEQTGLLLWIGGLATIPATATGLISHEPYEATVLHDVIETHQLLGMLGTVVMIGLVIWRYLSRRKGQDAGTSLLYLAFAVVGLVWLFLLGGTGGNLVYEYGVNVRGVNPLLP
ncbi:DUF2231 domain-containing protein [Chloroflexi bacterium TSY]|nr:DUF2231 domain-containing protein [Chloroflexi bacterium TSY]